MRAALVIAAVAASGCAKLADVGGTCGNYVLDQNEDCDAGPGGSSRCTSTCQLVCQASQCLDGAGNPIPNYACGVDGLCHAPGGVLAGQSGSFPFTPISVTTTDIDGDGIQDLVGITLDTEVVRFGDRAGVLDRNFVTLVPGTSGAGPTFSDLDGDGHRDAFIPTQDGIVAMTSSSGVPLPFPFANSLEQRATCESGAPRGSMPFDDHHIITVIAEGGQLIATVLDLSSETCFGGAVPACGLADPAQNPLQVVTLGGYMTTAVTPTKSAVLAVSDGAQVCVLTIVEDTLGNFSITAQGAFANASLMGVAPVFAQIDGTAPACPALVVADAAGTWKRAAKAVTGGCAIDNSVAPVMLESFPLVPTGSVHVSPAIAGGAAPDLLAISPAGQFGGATLLKAYVSGTPRTIFQSTETLPVIAAADLDGDGVTEIVAASRFAQDFQILHRTTAPDGFLLERVPTDGVPVAFVLRDFDGNGLPDIAFLEVLTAGSRVDVAYSTPDRPLPPVPVASFATPIVAFMPIQLLDALDPGDKLQDLAIVQLITKPGDSKQTAALTALFGSAERTMFAYFDPRSQPEAAGSRFETVLTGQFFGAQENDLIAIQADIATGAASVWNLPNHDGFLDARSGKHPLAGLDYDCSQSPMLCGLSAVFTTIPVTGRDIVVGVDGQHHMAVIDPRAGVDSAPALTTSDLLTSLPEPPAPSLVIYRTLAADLAGNGRPELVLAFRPTNYGSADGARIVVCHVSDPGVVSDCTNLGAKGQPLAGYDCSDASAGRLTNRGRIAPYASAAGADLVAACIEPGTTNGHLFVVREDTYGAYTATPLLDAFYPLYVQVADVTGDGVDDVMILSLDTMRSEPALDVYPQCDAHGVCP